MVLEEKPILSRCKLADKEESFHQCQFLRSQTFSTQWFNIYSRHDLSVL